MNVLERNGGDYDLITRCVPLIKDVKGLTCEIGLRGGGGTEVIIDALIENKDIRTHIALDPYGSIPYIQSDKEIRGGPDSEEEFGPYANDMMKGALAVLYNYIRHKDINVYFYPLEDTEFFKRFYDGVPVYQNGKKEVIDQYALVYFDGPHSVESTLKETIFFAQHRTSTGSILIYDDIENYYDHSKVQEYLEAYGWKELETLGSKRAYIKGRE